MRDGGGRVNGGLFAPHVMGRNGANRGFGFIWLGYWSPIDLCVL